MPIYRQCLLYWKLGCVWIPVSLHALTTVLLDYYFAGWSVLMCVIFGFTFCWVWHTYPLWASEVGPLPVLYKCFLKPYGLEEHSFPGFLSCLCLHNFMSLLDLFYFLVLWICSQMTACNLKLKNLPGGFRKDDFRKFMECSRRYVLLYPEKV